MLFPFDKFGSFSGTVCGFVVRSDLGSAIEHVVQFEEDATFDLSWYRFSFNEILLGHEKFMSQCTPTAGICGQNMRIFSTV